MHRLSPWHSRTASFPSSMRAGSARSCSLARAAKSAPMRKSRLPRHEEHLAPALGEVGKRAAPHPRAVPAPPRLSADRGFLTSGEIRLMSSPSRQISFHAWVIPHFSALERAPLLSFLKSRTGLQYADMRASTLRRRGVICQLIQYQLAKWVSHLHVHGLDHQ